MFIVTLRGFGEVEDTVYDVDADTFSYNGELVEFTRGPIQAAGFRACDLKSIVQARQKNKNKDEAKEAKPKETT